MEMTNQLVYVSATPAEFEIRTALSGTRITFRISARGSARTSRCRLFCLARKSLAQASSLPSPKTPSGSLHDIPGRTNRQNNSMFIRRGNRWWWSKSFGRPGCSIPRSPFAAKESNRRHHRALPAAGGKTGARAGHYADQTHGRGFGGLSARCRTESPLFA